MSVQIARCPEHGLHGERDECFVCGGPVEQVKMVEANVVIDFLTLYQASHISGVPIDEIDEAERALERALGIEP